MVAWHVDATNDQVVQFLPNREAGTILCPAITFPSPAALLYPLVSSSQTADCDQTWLWLILCLTTPTGNRLTRRYQGELLGAFVGGLLGARPWREQL